MEVHCPKSPPEPPPPNLPLAGCIPPRTLASSRQTKQPCHVFNQEQDQSIQITMAWNLTGVVELSVAFATDNASASNPIHPSWRLIPDTREQCQSCPPHARQSPLVRANLQTLTQMRLLPEKPDLLLQPPLHAGCCCSGHQGPIPTNAVDEAHHKSQVSLPFLPCADLQRSSSPASRQVSFSLAVSFVPFPEFQQIPPKKSVKLERPSTETKKAQSGAAASGGSDPEEQDHIPGPCHTPRRSNITQRQSRPGPAKLGINGDATSNSLSRGKIEFGANEGDDGVTSPSRTETKPSKARWEETAPNHNARPIKQSIPFQTLCPEFSNWAVSDLLIKMSPGHRPRLPKIPVEELSKTLEPKWLRRWWWWFR